MWIHWNTDTSKVKEMLDDSAVEYITGRCPMMYLGSGLSIHGVHREVAKLMGKYCMQYLSFKICVYGWQSHQ